MKTAAGKYVWTAQERAVKASLDDAIDQISEAKKLWKMGIPSSSLAVLLERATEYLATFQRQAALYDAANNKDFAPR